MKKLSFILMLIFSTTLNAWAQKFNPEHLYPIEASHSYVNFEVDYMTYAKVRGSFKSFYGSIYYNPQDPSLTSVSFQIDVETIDTNHNWRDRDLKSENWFGAEKFPYIRFSSSKVGVLGDSLEVQGTLSIRDHTREIRFKMAKAKGPIQDIRGDDMVVFKGEYTLSRQEFGVIGSNWSQTKAKMVAISDAVSIQFSFLGKQINEKNFSNFVKNTQTPQGKVYAAYQEKGKEAALESYETINADSKAGARPLNLLAYMLMKKNQDKDALVFLKKIQEKFPEEGNTYDSLGEWYAKQGQFAKAKEYYQKSLALDPNNLNAVEILKHL